MGVFTASRDNELLCISSLVCLACNLLPEFPSFLNYEEQTSVSSVPSQFHSWFYSSVKSSLQCLFSELRSSCLPNPSSGSCSVNFFIVMSLLCTSVMSLQWQGDRFPSNSQDPRAWSAIAFFNFVLYFFAITHKHPIFFCWRLLTPELTFSQALLLDLWNLFCQI